MSNKPNNDADRKFDILVAETMGADADHPPRISVIYPAEYMPGHPTGEPHAIYCWSGFNVPFDSVFVAVPVSWLDNSNKYDVLEDVAIEPNLWYTSRPLGTCRVRRAEAEEIAADLHRRSMTRLSEEIRTVKTSLDVAEKEFIRLRERYEQVQSEYDAASRLAASYRPLGFENPPPPEPSTTKEEQPHE